MLKRLYHIVSIPKLLTAAPIVQSLHKPCFNKDTQDADKKINDVRKQYHSNKNYKFYGLITHLGLTKYYNRMNFLEQD